MSFWKFCEKLEIGLGKKIVLENIEHIYKLYMSNRTVGDVIEELKEEDQTVFSSVKSLTENYRNTVFMPRMIIADILENYPTWATTNKTPKFCIDRLRQVITDCRKTIKYLEKIPEKQEIKFPLHEVVEWNIDGTTLRQLLIDTAEQKLGLQNQEGTFDVTYEDTDIVLTFNPS
jgi:hypothetical protein